MTNEQTTILTRCKELAGPVRAESFGLAAEWILNNANVPGTLVETGRYRGTASEGHSTLIFAILSKETGAPFISIDTNVATQSLAEQLLDKDHMGIYAVFFNDDSAKTISALPPPIKFCYLDSAQSPQLELAEATTLVEKMAKPAAILIDDCGGPDGGKSALSVPFLQSRGWKLAYSAFQRFLVLE